MHHLLPPPREQPERVRPWRPARRRDTAIHSSGKRRQAAATLLAVEVLPRLGRWIAALSGVGLLASLFVDWYGQQIFCLLLVGPCPQPGVSGWEALSGRDVLLAGAAALGPLPLLLGSAWRSAARPTAAVALLGSLLAALLVVHRIAVVPRASGLDQASVRLAGLFLALAAALALAGGAMLATAGDRLFQRRRAATPLIATAVGAGGLIATLFLPWTDAAFGVGPAVPVDGATRLSAWEAFRVADVLLAAVGLGLLAGVAMAAVLRWRALHFALALGGWLGAALAVFATPLTGSLGGPTPDDYDYGAGYHLCLAACAVIVLAGVWAGAGPERHERQVPV